MQSIEEEVEEERETEGRPANSQHCEDSWGSDDMRNSRGVYHRDRLSWGGYYNNQGQTNN